MFLEGVSLVAVAPLEKSRAGSTPAIRAPRVTLRAVWAIFRKDWCSEWRTRAALNAIALFAVAAPIALSFSVARQKLEPETLAGLLWTTLLFAALVGLSRVFVKEEESGTMLQLRLHCAADAVLWGKVLFNAVLLLATQVAAVPIFIVLLGAHVERPILFILVLVLSDVGLAVASTLLGAMASGARAKSALFAAIAIPVLLPLLVASASATAATLGAPGNPWPALQTIAAYDVAMITAAWMLFDFVWES